MKGKKLSPLEQEAMMKVCQEMMDSMDGMMGEGIKGAKKGMKVSVAAPSKAGLSEGLDMAESIVGDEDSDDEPDYESQMQSDEMSGINLSGESEEDLDAKIAELMAKKAKLKA